MIVKDHYTEELFEVTAYEWYESFARDVFYVVELKGDNGFTYRYEEDITYSI